MILDVRGIDTYYGLGHILHGLSLGVGEGEVVALLGRNGAGKTTTLRSITGLTPPARGTITYKGASIGGMPAHRISQLGIALVPETRGIFSYLTARENLEIARRPGSRWRERRSRSGASARHSATRFRSASTIPRARGCCSTSTAGACCGSATRCCACASRASAR